MEEPALRFLHAADLHLDTPFEGLAIRDPALRERLVDASLDALDALVDAAIAEGVLFVALAGDVYDGAERGLRAQGRLLAATRRLDAAGIWTFIAHGNHDPVGEGWAAIRAWPERVRIFPGDRAESFELFTQGGQRVTVTGTSFPTRDVRVGLHARFRRPAGEGFHVAVLHANVGKVAEHVAYSPCSLDELVGLGFDAWLLGHVHQRQVLREVSPLVAYPGNLQGRSFKPSERGEKGAHLVEVRGGSPTVRFRRLGPIRFEAVDVDVSGCEDLGEVIEALVEAARPLAGDAVVLRARLTGASPAYDDLALAQLQDPEALRGAVIDRGGALPGVHWAEIAVEVGPPVDLDALRGRADLPGELVREADRLREDATPLRLALADQPGLKELLARAGPGEVDDWLVEARDLALTLLGGGAP